MTVQPTILSLDAMSGDLGAEVVVRASAATLEKYRNVELIIVGDESELNGLPRVMTWRIRSGRS